MSERSFRGRLRLFFTLIVIIPMIAVALVLFTLTADSERGKADAGIARGLRTTFSIYGDAQRRAQDHLRRIAADPALNVALVRDRRAAAAARLRRLERRDPDVLSVTLLDRRGATLAEAGSPLAVAPAVAPVSARGGRPIGTLAVATTDAQELVADARRRTGLEIAVLRGGRTLATTVPAASAEALRSDSDEFEVDGREYRGRRETVGQPAALREEIAAFEDASDLNSAIGDRRRVIAAILLAFLILALASSVFVVRALQDQIGRFLTAARRLAKGDFAGRVPIHGRDEFAALGREFNSMSDQLEAKIEEVERKRGELEETIRRVGQAFASGLDSQGIVELAVRTAVDACEADVGRALPLDRRLLAATHVGSDEPALEAALERAEREAFKARPETGPELLEAGDSGPTARSPTSVEHEGTHAMALPVTARLGSRTYAQYVGVVSIARRERPFRREDVELLEYLVGQAVVSIENADLHETVQRQAVTDELTGLSNVRELHAVLDRELERRRRFETPLGLVLLDIDDFKAVNDEHGHRQGDEVLIRIARVLGSLSRDIDEPARYGGEELAVVLPQTDVGGAAQAAERMREAIERLRIPLLDGTGELAVTASFGVAAVPATARDKNSLIAVTDAALYRAKRAGKNRVERAEPVTVAR